MPPLTPFSGREPGTTAPSPLFAPLAAAHLWPSCKRDACLLADTVLFFFFPPPFARAGNTQRWKYMGARKTELIGAVLDYKLAFNILNQKNLPRWKAAVLRPAHNSRVHASQRWLRLLKHLGKSSRAPCLLYNVLAICSPVATKASAFFFLFSQPPLPDSLHRFTAKAFRGKDPSVR